MSCRRHSFPARAKRNETKRNDDFDERERERERGGFPRRRPTTGPEEDDDDFFDEKRRNERGAFIVLLVISLIGICVWNWRERILFVVFSFTNNSFDQLETFESTTRVPILSISIDRER